MRLRVLALPPHTLGPATRQPFLLVFDRCPDAYYQGLGDAKLKDVTGAEGVLVFADEVELDDRQMIEIDEFTLRGLRAKMVGF